MRSPWNLITRKPNSPWKDSSKSNTPTRTDTGLCLPSLRWVSYVDGTLQTTNSAVPRSALAFRHFAKVATSENKLYSRDASSHDAAQWQPEERRCGTLFVGTCVS